VTRWPGFYILQWKFHTMPACAATNLPRVDDVLASLQVSSHKCKVMYYTEVIGSEDFRFVPERLWQQGYLFTVCRCPGHGRGSVALALCSVTCGQPWEAASGSGIVMSLPYFTRADG